MKLAIINNLRFPTEKAHGYQIAKMCEAYARLGHEVELIYPYRHNPIAEDLFTFYRVQKNFSTKEIKMIDLFKTILPSALTYWLMSLTLSVKVSGLKFDQGTIVISRNPELIWLLGRRGIKIYYDVHNWPQRYSSILRWLLKPASGVIANSVGTAADAVYYGLTNVLVAPNGVELSDFTGREAEVAMIRKKYHLEGKITLVYAGHFYHWKGVNTLITAMKILPADKYTCLLVGAGPKSRQSNVITIGQIPHYEVAAYLLAADILVLPTVPVSVEAERYTSPLKLFEYLAAGRPIVASDLPSSRAIVSNQEACFFPAGNVEALINEVDKLAMTEDGRKELGMACKKLAENYTWAKRAEKIINFIKTLP